MCFKLSSRQYIRTPFTPADFLKQTPRCYHNYTITGSPDGGYFASSIINSFPDLYMRTNFLNHFYQCLLCGQLPIKSKKLVTVGPSDSGKSSWARILFGLTAKTNVATISKEKTFGTSLLKENTQLIFIDEWCNDTLSSDMAKILFQGKSNIFQWARGVMSKRRRFDVATSKQRTFDE